MSKKYEFKSIGLDTFELHNLKTKEIITFKRTIDVMKMLQNVEPNARLAMIDFMKSHKDAEGNPAPIRKDDLIIEKTNPDGTKSYDESYYRDMESSFLHQEYTKIATDVYSKTIGKSLEAMVSDLGLENDAEASEFGIELGKILMGANVGETPSGNNESISGDPIKKP